MFALEHSSKETDTLFVNKLRFDVAAHTVVCHAFVLALSQDIAQATLLLVPQGIMPISPHVSRGTLLPALAERCRMTWAHGANCEYRTAEGNARVPHELPAVPGDQGIPLCSCGRGKDVEGMVRDRVWRMFSPFVTRIALSPLLGASHVEQILEPQDMFGMGRNIDSSLELDAELVPNQAPGPGPANTLVSVRARGSKTDTVTMSGSDAGG